MSLDEKIHALSNAMITLSYFIDDVAHGAVKPEDEDGQKHVNSARTALGIVDDLLTYLRDHRHDLPP